MSYRAFCSATGYNPTAPDTFHQFALVGGVPRYWEMIERGRGAVELAQTLFFGSSPFLEFEPSRLLKDEGITGVSALALLEAIGRGAQKPSESAGRLGTPQTNLSRVFQVLLDAGILERQLPFGESVRTTRRTLYKIVDPTLRFWFRVYSPHRSRWQGHSSAERERLVADHASTVFEDCVRAAFVGAQRYWDASVELDLVRAESVGGLTVLEVIGSELRCHPSTITVQAREAGAAASTAGSEREGRTSRAQEASGDAGAAGPARWRRRAACRSSRRVLWLSAWCGGLPWLKTSFMPALQ